MRSQTTLWATAPSYCAWIDSTLSQTGTMSLTEHNSTVLNTKVMDVAFTTLQIEQWVTIKTEKTAIR